MCSRQSAATRQARSPTASCTTSRAQPARALARARACTRRTRCRRAPRRSAWRCPAPPPRPPSPPSAPSRPAAPRRPRPGRRPTPRRTGEITGQALASGLRPRQVMTRAAFLNAAAVVMATAGSTNAVLHLLAIANEAEVELTLDDFDAVSRRTPHIVSMRPAGRFIMSELDQAGGLPVVLKELLSAGLVDGDALSVNGRTLAENVQDAFAPDGDVVHPVKDPIGAEGGLAVLRGSLAPRGALVKVPGIETLD